MKSRPKKPEESGFLCVPEKQPEEELTEQEKKETIKRYMILINVLEQCLLFLKDDNTQLLELNEAKATICDLLLLVKMPEEE
jgi:hypothetical protein